MENVSSLGDQSRSSDNIETTSANPQEEQPDDNRDEDAGISLIKVDIFFLCFSNSFGLLEVLLSG